MGQSQMKLLSFDQQILYPDILQLITEFCKLLLFFIDKNFSSDDIM